MQLGGLLELASEVGKGTTATLWLPQAVKPASEVVLMTDQAMPGMTGIQLAEIERLLSPA